MLLYMERCIEFYVKSLCDILLLNVVKFRLLGSIWLEGGGKAEWDDRKYFIFSSFFFLVGSGKVEGWKK